MSLMALPTVLERKIVRGGRISAMTAAGDGGILRVAEQDIEITNEWAIQWNVQVGDWFVFDGSQCYVIRSEDVGERLQLDPEALARVASASKPPARIVGAQGFKVKHW